MSVVSGFARMPAHQTTVAAGMRSPEASVAPPASMPAMATFARVSTPTTASASPMIGIAWSPMFEPMRGAESARITRA
jgi:hypothetical protein